MHSTSAPTYNPHPATNDTLRNAFADSELIIGLVGAVGTELQKVRDTLEDWLKKPRYNVTQIRITKEVIPETTKEAIDEGSNEYDRLKSLMNAGDKAREDSGDNSILALGAASAIDQHRKNPNEPRRAAFIVSSLKHPEEVARLREIYPEGFYLIGVHSDREQRFRYLTETKRISPENAEELIKRDHDEHLEYGQKVAETYHLSDFFVRIDGHDDHLRNSLWRILELLFGHPYITPTFDEHAMFLAFAASVSSADLSRQVGAVVALGDQVVATGANDCPKADGGRYWPILNECNHHIEDQENGRDFKRKEDSNRIEQQRIINDIVARAKKANLPEEEVDNFRESLQTSRVADLTEFGRVVHAEMDALLACSRAHITTRGATLYTTTFPCHNCAKHIISAGIQRVVFVEPYQKSMAAEFHPDSIEVGFNNSDSSDRQPKVRFQPFVGVGPRRFVDLFSTRLGSGYKLKRKYKSTGKTLEWKPENARLRLQMLPTSYLRSEKVAGDMFLELLAKEECDNGE